MNPTEADTIDTPVASSVEKKCERRLVCFERGDSIGDLRMHGTMKLKEIGFILRLAK